MLLVWRPSDLFTPSFQLTAISVCAIVAFAFPVVEKLRAIGRWMPSAGEPFPPNVSDRLRRFCELLYWNETVWRIENARHIWSANLFKRSGLWILTAPNLQTLIAYLFEGALVSLIVQIWMLPLVVIYFHRVSGASILLNLWVGIFLAAESFAGVFALMLGNVSEWLAAPFVVLTELLNSAMMSVPALFSDLGFAGSRLPAYSGYGRIVYVLYGIAVAFVARQFFQWRPFDLRCTRWTLPVAISPIAAIVLAAIIIHHPFCVPAADGRLRVHFLDVGQGDSALVVFPDGKTMLIDGGGKPNLRGDDAEISFTPDVPRIGEAVVSEFLWEQGYSRIDYILATHADADHMQGLVDVAKNFEIGSLILGSMPAGDSEYDDLMRVVSKRGIPVSKVRRGDELHISDVTLRVLNPTTDAGPGSQNDSSVVLRIDYGSRSLLMTGDIESSTEANLIADRCDAIRADIVKVPHHGSRTSSTDSFVNCTRPSIAIFSVGRRSRFGHPHAEVVERWRAAGVQMMKTGEKGTITITTDGDAIETQTFVP
jgi:competence protein ComEC